MDALSMLCLQARGCQVKIKSPHGHGRMNVVAQPSAQGAYRRLGALDACVGARIGDRNVSVLYLILSDLSMFVKNHAPTKDELPPCRTPTAVYHRAGAVSRFRAGADLQPTRGSLELVHTLSPAELPHPRTAQPPPAHAAEPTAPPSRACWRWCASGARTWAGAHA